MKRRDKMLLGLCFCFTVATVLVLLEFRRGVQYHLGMTIQEAQILTHERYPVRSFFPTNSDIQQTEEAIEGIPYKYIYDESNGVMLLFDKSDRLIEKQRIKIFGVNIYELADRVRGVFQ